MLLQVTTNTIDGITATPITGTTDPLFPTTAIARIRRQSISAPTLEHRFRFTHIAGGGSEVVSRLKHLGAIREGH